MKPSGTMNFFNDVPKSDFEKLSELSPTISETLKQINLLNQKLFAQIHHFMLNGENNIESLNKFFPK